MIARGGNRRGATTGNGDASSSGEGMGDGSSGGSGEGRGALIGGRGICAPSAGGTRTTAIGVDVWISVVPASPAKRKPLNPPQLAIIIG